MGRKGARVPIVSDSGYEITFPYKGKRCRERIRTKPSPSNTRKLTQFRAAYLMRPPQVVRLRGLPMPLQLPAESGSTSTASPRVAE